MFGVNPHTDISWHSHMEERISKTFAEMKRRCPSHLVCVGGEAWYERGQRTTEADYLAKQIRSDIPSEITLLISSKGLETVQQVDELLQLLDEEGLGYRHLSIVTSWHQLPRIALMIFVERRKIITLLPTKETPKTIFRWIEYFYNCIFGLGYTALLLGMRKFGFWEDGGPVIRHFRESRKR